MNKTTNSPLHVHPEDQADHDAGNSIANVLCLKRDRKGWFRTAWGDKTPAGLARTVRRILDEASRPLPPPVAGE